MEGNKFWGALKTRLDWGARRSMWQIFAAAILFPIAENILMNLWTGAPAGQGYIPGWTLFAVVLVHFPLAALIIASETNSPEKALADAVEVQEELTAMKKELKRRTDAYRMVVSAVQAFNSEVCHIDPYNYDPLCKVVSYEDGLKPVMMKFIQNINTTLGVTSHQFSLEVYLIPGVRVAKRGPCIACHGMSLEFFYSPQGDRCAPSKLSNNSPAHLGKAKLVASQHHIDSDKPLFYMDGEVKPEIYFHQYATTVISWPCDETTFMGLLVLTSLQDEPFADDAIETMKFMASVILNYTNRYSTCVAFHDSFEQDAA